MFRLIVRMAGVAAYLLITLEMIFMVTPFALYYYSAYSPLLSTSSRVSAIAWLPAFFLRHLSTDIVPSVGGLILVLGLVGFLLSAFQLYRAKFTRRGMVRSVFYKRIRHPQYLWLAISGLGLVIVWPRFVLLLVYIHMLWFYYLLAQDEERRMRAAYGDAYQQHTHRTWMFLPGEPGGYLKQRVFGWIKNRRVQLFVVYGVSVAASIGIAFGLREISLGLTPHVRLRDEMIAVISFQSASEQQLRKIVDSTFANAEIHTRVKPLHEWVLVQVMEGKSQLVHTMIDAGMTRANARNLQLTDQGTKIVVLHRTNAFTPNDDPFSAREVWQPILVVEITENRISRVLELDSHLFPANPVMPIF
jgi:protein-S-isoprenylcysteine O-methyltransferase Ste14